MGLIAVQIGLKTNPGALLTDYLTPTHRAIIIPGKKKE